MAHPPGSIQVYTIPTNAGEPYLERFRTIETPISWPIYPSDLPPRSHARLEYLKTKAAKTHLIYDLPEGIQNGPHDGVYKGRYQPDIRLLPDTRDCWKTEDWRGWGKRAAIDLKGYHLFYLRDEVTPLNFNKHAEYQVQGEMFLLKVSDARDKTGRRFYVDVDCGAEDLDDLIKSLGTVEYFGPQKWEKDILAARMSLDGTDLLYQYIHTVTKPFQVLHSLEEKDSNISHVRYLKDEHAESTVERVPLPDTRPYYPEHSNAQEVRKVRDVVGNTKFHAFFSLAREDGEELTYKTRFSFLKVSGDVDHNGRWFYEDVDLDREQLLRGLCNLLQQMNMCKMSIIE